MSKVEQKIRNNGYDIEYVFGRNKKNEMIVVGYRAVRLWLNDGARTIFGKSLTAISKKL